MMKQRDKQILNDLQRFRVMRRDDIIDLYFSDLKQPVTGCNTVMKRLRRDKYVKAITDRNQFFYMPAESNIKADSTKLPHFLRIVEFYREICKIDKPRIFTIEPKYSDKGTVEPDVFMMWKGAPFFVEIQRSIYSQKVMNEKLDRYDAFYHSDIWRSESWQPKNKQVFPYIWVITDTRYKVEGRPYKVFQSASVSEFLASIKQ